MGEAFLQLVFFIAAIWLGVTDTQICNTQVSQISFFTGYTTQTTYYSQHYTISCGSFGWKRCNRYRTVSQVNTVAMNYSTVQYQSVPVCCVNYTGSPPNCDPICDPSCLNGNCSSPSVCTCNPGWTGNVCSKDIAECDYVDCEHSCINTNGSYYCTCNSGHVLAADGHMCDDTDECSVKNGGCIQLCINTVGSYECSCGTGYVLDSDGHTCNDTNECSTDNGGCVQTCINTPGSYRCRCDGERYTLNSDGYTCDDIDECGSAASSAAGCEHSCINTNGSYYCSCNTGYVLAADGHMCTDVDECATNNGGCMQICINTVGSYECSCEAGYTMKSDGHTCAATVSSTVTSITPLFPVTTAIETDLTVSTSFLSSTEFVVVAVVAGVLLMVLLSGSIAIPAVVCALRRRKYSFMGRPSTAPGLALDNIIYDMPIPTCKEFKMTDCAAYGKTISRPIPVLSSDEKNVYDTVM